MALNDIYNLVATWRHASGQEAQFVQDYKLTAYTGDIPQAGALVSEYLSDLADIIRNRLHPSWSQQSVVAKNYNNPSDFYENFTTAPGLEAGNALPSFLAIGFRSPRKGTGVNRGRHSLPIGTVGYIGGDGSLTAAGRDACYFVQQQLGLPLGEEDALGQWTPVITEKTYEDHVLVSVTERAVVTGQWQINRYFTTMKSRQSYLWEIAEEPA